VCFGWWFSNSVKFSPPLADRNDEERRDCFPPMKVNHNDGLFCGRHCDQAPAYGGEAICVLKIILKFSSMSACAIGVKILCSFLAAEIATESAVSRHKKKQPQVMNSRLLLLFKIKYYRINTLLTFTLPASCTFTTAYQGLVLSTGIIVFVVSAIVSTTV
jgi:hypothetical protein